MDATILLSIMTWAGITGLSGIIGNTADRAFQGTTFTSLKEKLSSFFTKEDEFEKLVQEIQTRKASNPLKPYRDLEDLYEEITGGIEYPEEMTEIIKNWVLENQDTLKEFYTDKSVHVGGVFNIEKQTAGRDVNNISNSTVHIN